MIDRSSRWGEFKLKLVAYGVYIVFRLLIASYRMRVFGGEHRQRAESLHPLGNFGIALWHQNLMAAVASHRYQNISPMISASADGDLVAFAAEKLGMTPVRGSSTRGGKEARSELQEKLKVGFHGALTVDGPKGPPHKVKSGIIALARDHQIPILPLAAVADRAWVLRRSWDQFRIPKPFSRVAVCYGAPIMIPAGTHGQDFVTAKQRVGESIDALEAFARESLEQW